MRGRKLRDKNPQWEKDLSLFFQFTPNKKQAFSSIKRISLVRKIT